jgi:hypothetical protein
VNGTSATLDQMVMAAAIGDQVADRADLEAVAAGEGDEIVHPRHRAVVLHDLADHARGLSPARREMSTAASVWPVRTSTPPSRAISGRHGRA